MATNRLPELLPTDTAANRPLAPGKGVYFYRASDTGAVSLWLDGAWYAVGGGAPSGSAGGDLAGTYPNPTVADLTIASEARGDLLRRGASAWERVAAKAADTFVGGDGTDVAVRTAAQVVASLQSAARTLPESIPAGATWTESAGLGTADDATLTLTLPGSTATPTTADCPYLSAPHNRNPWQLEVTARLVAFTGGSTTTWTALLIADASGTTWILAQARGDGELSIISNAGFVAAVSGAFALTGNDRLRILVRDGVVTVYVGDGTHWTRRYHSEIGGSLPGATSGDFARIGLRLSESTGAAGTVTAQWADVTVRSL